jgi:hypothetical protein
MGNMSENEIWNIISNEFPNYEPDSIEDALNFIINDGVYDDIVSVEGNEPENAVRIANWILWTDSQGNMSAHDYESESVAIHLIECYDKGIENPGI